MAEHTHEHANDGSVHVHIHPVKFYAGILGALMFLTVVTVAASYVDIDGFLAMGAEVEGVGAWNLIVAILIATMKASLVVLFFMHLKDDSRFNALVFVGSLLFVGVFFAYTMNDTGTRGATGDRYNGVHIDPDTGERAPGGIPAPIPGEVLEPGMVAPEGADAHGAEGEAHEGEEAAGEEAAGDEAATLPADAADVLPGADQDGIAEDSVQAEVAAEALDQPELEASDLPEEAEAAREPGPDTETPTEESDPVGVE
ncbi:MAG: cytochrome C oxidase subunit IV family protein [Sandaracinaceae bacterium]